MWKKFTVSSSVYVFVFFVCRDVGLYYKTLEEYGRDGLTSLNYTTNSYREMSLYTRISVDLLRDSATTHRISISVFATTLITSALCIRTIAFYS